MAMFEGFETKTLAGEGADIFCRIGGEGPPLLLLHGFPQTGAMWMPLVERLARRFTLVIPDLRGYGRSSHPDSKGGAAYSKRLMAADMLAVMGGLGFERFALAGHDRGARVAYRLALDSPERVERLALLDILPTAEVWSRMDAGQALSAYHWGFLAQPNPLPERLISADPVYFIDHTLASWTRNRSLAPFASEALADYRRAIGHPGVVHAMCEDYRAGATLDRDHDREALDAGRRIAAPTLVLWGSNGAPATGGDVLAAWRERWCESAQGQALDCGHFVVEEAPEETGAALETFFGGR